MIDEAVDMRPIDGGWHVKTRDDGNACIDIMAMIYNYRIVLTTGDHDEPSSLGIEHGWCYFGHGVNEAGLPRTMHSAFLAAVAAAVVWDGYGAPSGFDKQAC